MAFPWGEEGTATTLCPPRDFPCRENIPLPGRLTSFLIFLPKPEGQLDVPKHCQQPGAAPQQLHGVQRARSLVESEEDILSAKRQHFLSFSCGFYAGLSCQKNPPPSAGKWEEDWLLCWGSCEITDFPVISLPLFRLARANFPVSTQAANPTLPAQSHRNTHTHMLQEAHAGSSSRFWVVGAPWHSTAATHPQLEEGTSTQLSISSASPSKAQGALGKMLPDSQQACGPCFLKHWALSPHMPRQQSCMATSAISSCPQQFLSLLELLWSRFMRGQGAQPR